MSGKRTYGQYTQERMVGGRKLRYNYKPPVAFSSRWYNQSGAARAVGMQTAVMRARAKPEVKGVDILLTQASPIGAAATGNTNTVLLNAIAPGSGSYNRIGRKVTLKSLRLKGTVQFTSTPSGVGAVTGNWVRMVVVWDQQPSSGAIADWPTIFGYTDQAGTEASTTQAPLRYDNMDRFKILKDCMIDYKVMPSIVGSSCIEQVPFDEFISLGNREVVYSGQTVPCSIADISTGALIVYFRAYLNSAVTAAEVTPNSVARLRYMD